MRKETTTKNVVIMMKNKARFGCHNLITINYHEPCDSCFCRYIRRTRLGSGLRKK